MYHLSQCRRAVCFAAALALVAAGCATPLADGPTTPDGEQADVAGPSTVAADGDASPDGDADGEGATDEGMSDDEAMGDAPAATEPVPTTAAELAPALSEAELAVRRTDATPAERAAWGHRQQRLYRVLAVNPGWLDEVTAAVDPSVRTAVERNTTARVELNALLAGYEPGDTLPAWRVAEPKPAEELLGYYREAAERHNVPWEVLAAINLVETRMGRINGVSSAGAQGPMQFLPSTWEECCEGDPTDDRDAINGAAQYLVDRGAPGDMARAIFGYNNSDAYVAAITAYADVLTENPDAYYGYHGWQVYYSSAAGLLLLPVGYEESEPIDAAQWLAANPDQRLVLGDS
ncbi:MAG: lytic transglycosylase domain-containing protein [Actinomycetota bacterium]